MSAVGPSPTTPSEWDDWVNLYDDWEHLMEEYQARYQWNPNWRGFNHLDQAIIRRWDADTLAKIVSGATGG